MYPTEQCINKCEDRSRRLRKWSWIVGIFVCAVVLCTTYILILPANTLEWDCGMVEHIHSEMCYSQVASKTVHVIDCDINTHIHTEDCNEVCGYADFVVHEHNELCYDGDVCICTLPVVLEHRHTDDCYRYIHTHDDGCFEDYRGGLTCDQEEGQGHIHGDECYVHEMKLVCEEESTEKELFCGEDEIVLHIHEGNCFDSISGDLICKNTEIRSHVHNESCVCVSQETMDTQELTCDMSEGENHIHSALCYGTWVLECAETVHTHTDECRKMNKETEATESSEGGSTYIYNEMIEVDSSDNHTDEFLSAEGNKLSWVLLKNTLTNEHTIIIDGVGAIKEYGSHTDTPWYKYHSDKGLHLVFGENITRIGRYAFAHRGIYSIEWGGIQTIGAFAFYHSSFNYTLYIPGTVIEIENEAFNYAYGHGDIVITEGTKKLGAKALARRTPASMTAYIPASLTSYDYQAFGSIKEFTVSEDNPSFCEIDGVLFSKDKKVLVDYPTARIEPDGVYEVPEGTEKIGAMVFAGVYGTKKFILPGTIKSIPGNLFRQSAVEEVYMEDGCVPTTYMMFYSASNLRSLRLPENTPINIYNLFHGSSAPNLRTFKIPNGTEWISAAFCYNERDKVSLPGLETVIYDAQKAKINCEKVSLGGISGFELVIGKNVDQLVNNFKSISPYAGTIKFEASNTIYADAQAFSGTVSPINRLSGMLYVDAQGLVYICDPETKTASVAYCQPDIKEITVPDSVSPDDGNIYTVTSVLKDAFRYADDLQEITFVKLSNITVLEKHAMANCITLKSVNGETTVDGADALFAHAEKGYGIFYNTGLDDAPGSGAFDQEMNGSKNQILEHEKTSTVDIRVVANDAQWVGDSDDSGGYRLFTEQEAVIYAKGNNTQENQTNRYRLYFRITSDDAYLSVTPGISDTINSWQYTCYATDDPYTVYIEFGKPPEGETKGLYVIAKYNKDTPGGGLTVWGLVVPEGTEQGTLIESDDVIQLSWVTKADDFEVSNVPTTNKSIKVTADGKGSGKPAENLAWTIKLQREDEAILSVGKDYAKGAEFRDEIILPKGVYWQDEVLDAIKNQNVSMVNNCLYANGLMFAQVAMSGTGLNINGFRAELENGNMVLKWRTRSGNIKAEMDTATITLTIFSEALKVVMSESGETYDPTIGAEIKSEVYATVHYKYGIDASYSIDTETGDEINPQLHAGSTRKITGGEEKVLLDIATSGASCFGEDITYTTRIFNDGALHWYADDTTRYYLNDSLSKYAYIPAEGMERMFASYPELEVTIKNATLGTWNEVLGTNWGSAWIHPGNTDMSTTSQNLTITYNPESGYTVVCSNGDTKTKNTVAEALQSVGYAVTSNDSYYCSIPLNDEDEKLCISAGSEIVFYIYARVKDTFQISTIDWESEYPSNASVSITSEAYISAKGSDKSIASDWCRSDSRRETQVSKSVSRNGKDLYGNYGVNDGDVLDYNVYFRHYGKGAYENLPMVDELYGSQYLLVPVDYNMDNNELSGLETIEHKGLMYYVLTEGIYHNVVAGTNDEGIGQNAAQITVRKSEDEQIELNGVVNDFNGIHTTIKWYFSNLPGSPYLMRMDYKSIVDLDVSGVEYTIGNLILMNDRSNSRIYATVGGGGTLVDFEKDIVLKKGIVPSNDQLAPEKYSLVGQGESVVYRLKISGTEYNNIVLRGNKLADGLPYTYDKINFQTMFEWQKGVNVTDFFYKTEGDVICQGLEDWYIGTEYGGFLNEGSQYILWPESTQITISQNSAVYLYFTLTYPSNSEDNNLWDRYSDMVGGDRIDNKMYVYRFSSIVYHGIKEAGHAMLQKGVYGTYYDKEPNGNSLLPSFNRLNYNNRDSRNRYVSYYVVLYNGGNKRLYLNDIVDDLPDGFSFCRMMEGAPGTFAAFSNDDVVIKTATIHADKSNGLRFSFQYDETKTLKYDESCKQLYLDRGEAIEFAYLCSVGSSSETQDEAVNTISMKYTDHMKTGLTLVPKDELSVTGRLTENFNDLNDGRRIVRNNGDSEPVIYLASDVKLVRGGIVPGVTKNVLSFQQTIDDSPTPYKGYVYHNSIINWQVSLHNSGTLSMTDYTFKDIMPSPYSFVGEISYCLYGYGEENSDMGNGGGYGDHKKILEILERTEQEVVVKDLIHKDGLEVTLPVNGEFYTFGTDDLKFHVAFSKDYKNNEILEIRFEGVKFSVPEGGYMDLGFSSANNTNSFVYTVYTNQAELWPNPTQTFASVSQGSMIRDENSRAVGCKDVTYVTVSIGLTTTSGKRVITSDDESTGKNNRLVLKENNYDFRYRLYVTNDTNEVITKLVFIDSLPGIGDHHPFDSTADRGSDFSVSLGQGDFEVYVIDDTDTEVQSVVKNTIQYSTGVDFGQPQGVHWKGETPDISDPTQWTDNPMGAKSIRVIMTGSIQPGATAYVEFPVHIDGECNPGQVANNNFGYHYKTANTNTELEAMSQIARAKIPTVPTLQKKIVDTNGVSISATKDSQFQFLVYSGSPITEDYETTRELYEILDFNSRQYREFTVQIPKGKSISGELELRDENWEWCIGEQYTIIELPTDPEYTFASFAGSGTEYYNFVFDPGTDQHITCINSRNSWDIRVIKQSMNNLGEKEALSGAVFGLYSINSSDAIEVDGIQREVEYLGEKWYLAAFGTSDDEGMIYWSGMLRPMYFLLEVKVPDGYILPSDAGQILYRSDSERGYYETTVVNKVGYELPNTGGVGTVLCNASGIALVAISSVALLFMYIKKRKNRQVVS